MMDDMLHLLCMAVMSISKGKAWITKQKNKIYSMYMENTLHSNLVQTSSLGLSQKGLLDTHTPKV